MSRYNREGDIGPILQAAVRWRQVALESQGSVLGSEDVWSDANVVSLKSHYVDHPDLGEGRFLEKLERQLHPAPAGAKQLAAEMTWFMLLCPSNIAATNKRETVHTIWNWSGVPIEADSRWLGDDVLRGIGGAGTAFNTHRWRELSFFIGFIAEFRAVDRTSQAAMLADGWKFAEWIADVPDANHRQLRHMILYLLFPDDFERIFGATERRKILRGCTDLTNAQAASLSPLEIDREFKKIRVEQENKHQTKELDFYWPPLREIWQRDEEPSPTVTMAEESELAGLARVMRRSHVLRAIQDIDKAGFPHEARSTTYDLVHGANRYPPKYVLSLAAKHATGSELPRTHFSGGESSTAFKALRDLQFSIERKDFLPELVEKFLKQADAGTELATSDYPKSYRGLKVNVSFGKGNTARILTLSPISERFRSGLSCF